ncbi:hypothetical protein MGN70_010605 [Eutypa lata]|nr:hypothetical protein MGN70_010605 [Eutypa lata]
MPYYATSQEWLRQSSLLLEARPTTTRITTKYSITKPKPRKTKKSPEGEAQPTTTTTTEASTKPPRGALTLKTYDPVSGATLKYRTTKAAEVSRLILSLGKLGNKMAGLPGGPADDEVMADVVERTGTPVVAEKEKEKEKEVPRQAAQQQQQQQGGASGGGGGGGKGKKKRGKK